MVKSMWRQNGGGEKGGGAGESHVSFYQMAVAQKTGTKMPTLVNGTEV